MKTITNDFLQSHIIIANNDEDLDSLISNSNIDKDFIFRHKVSYPLFIVTMLDEDFVNSYTYPLDVNNEDKIKSIAKSFKAEVINFTDIK